jgi:hypothetical protein
VVVVGGNISAGDLIADLSSIVKSPLYLSQRGHNEALDAVFGLDGVVVKRKHQTFVLLPLKHCLVTPGACLLTLALIL